MFKYKYFCTTRIKKAKEFSQGEEANFMVSLDNERNCNF